MHLGERKLQYMKLKPVQKIKLSAQIEEQLQQQILNGKWKPGERLPSENALCRIFQVSRVSIRQALQSMSAKGLIETRDGNGSFVAQPTIGDYVQQSMPNIYLAEDSLCTVLEFRLLFEAPVAELAATRATDEQLQKMEELYKGMLDTSSNDLQEHSNLDYEMHALIGTMTHNAMVEGVYRVQNSILRSSWHHITTTIGVEKGIYYHGKLLEAFQARNAPLCRALMDEHVHSTWDMLYGENGQISSAKKDE